MSDAVKLDYSKLFGIAKGKEESAARPERYSSIGNIEPDQKEHTQKESIFKKRYGKIYRTVWEFHERYWPPTDHTNWDAMLQEADAIARQFQDDKFVSDMLIGIIADLDNINRRIEDSRT